MPNRDVRETGTLTDAYGRKLAIGQDYDAVYLEIGSVRIVLGPGVRGDFARLYFLSDEAAQKWAAENPQDEVVTAEIWCGLGAACINGPGDHLWHVTCQTRAEAAGIA